MGRRFTAFSTLFILSFVLSGCNAIGDKAASLTLVYGIAAVVSLFLLGSYLLLAKKKDPWYVVLFISVLVVNLGYLALALSQNLAEALWANRLAYLGSVFLPLAMWMIISRAAHLHTSKTMGYCLLGISILIFLISASPGYLDIYYQDVSFQTVNGVGTLVKVYGVAHPLYLIYLLGYFAAMVIGIIRATWQERIESRVYAIILAAAVFANIIVWLIEQLVQIDFEILSISYIITESFLLGLHILMEEASRKPASVPEPAIPAKPSEEYAFIQKALPTLTPKERELYDCYVSGMNTAQVMEHLNIKENTLKFHNKNLYSKLGVTSRKHLLEILRQ